MIDIEIYDSIAEELKKGKKEGLWLQCEIEANMDEKITKKLYVEKRFKEIKSDIEGKKNEFKRVGVTEVERKSKENIQSQKKDKKDKVLETPKKLKQNLTLVVCPHIDGALLKVSNIFFKINDQVKKGDVLCDVENENTVYEVESPYSGKIVSVFIKQSDTLNIQQNLFEIDESIVKNTDSVILEKKPSIKKVEPIKEKTNIEKKYLEPEILSGYIGKVKKIRDKQDAINALRLHTHMPPGVYDTEGYANLAYQCGCGESHCINDPPFMTIIANSKPNISLLITCHNKFLTMVRVKGFIRQSALSEYSFSLSLIKHLTNQQIINNEIKDIKNENKESTTESKTKLKKSIVEVKNIYALRKLSKVFKNYKIIDFSDTNKSNIDKLESNSKLLFEGIEILSEISPELDPNTPTTHITIQLVGHNFISDERYTEVQLNLKEFQRHCLGSEELELVARVVQIYTGFKNEDL